MSDLETAVQPALKPMITGHEVGLTRAGQQILARWAIKTAMTVELATSVRVFAQEDRAQLRERDAIPDGHSVFVAAASVAIARRGFISFVPFSFEGQLGSTNGYAVTLGIRHLVLQVVGSGKAGGWLLDIEEHPARSLNIALQVWPVLVESLSWPPVHVFHTPDQLTHFTRIVLPNR